MSRRLTEEELAAVGELGEAHRKCAVELAVLRMQAQELADELNRRGCQHRAAQRACERALTMEVWKEREGLEAYHVAMYGSHVCYLRPTEGGVETVTSCRNLLEPEMPDIEVGKELGEYAAARVCASDCVPARCRETRDLWDLEMRHRSPEFFTGRNKR